MLQHLLPNQRLSVLPTQRREVISELLLDLEVLDAHRERETSLDLTAYDYSTQAEQKEHKHTIHDKDCARRKLRPKRRKLVPSVHEQLSVRVRVDHVPKRLLVRVDPGTCRNVEEWRKPEQLEHRIVHFRVVNGGPTIEVCQADAVSGVENDHPEKCNREQNRKPRCE